MPDHDPAAGSNGRAANGAASNGASAYEEPGRDLLLDQESASRHDENPCLTAMRCCEVISIDDLLGERRFSRYRSRSLSGGGAVLALGLLRSSARARDVTLASLVDEILAAFDGQPPVVR